MNIFDMTGQVALVTGSTRGIGRATVDLMAEYGARVIVTGRDGDLCHQTARELNVKYGQEVAWPLQFDLDDEQSSYRLVDEAAGKWGRLDALVCNAFTSTVGRPSQTPAEEFVRVFRVNVVNTILMADRAAPILANGRNPSITFIGSVGGISPTPDVAAYTLSKRALLQAMVNMAVEWAPRGVRVNAVVPASTKTGTMKSIWSDPEKLKAYVSGFLIPRLIEPEEVGAACLFLASRAGSSMTGQSIVIDCGRTQPLPLRLPADYQWQ